MISIICNAFNSNFHKINCIWDRWYIYFSELAHEGDPIDSIQPIENGVIHFLDVTNNGLMVGQAPNQKANDLWTRISQRI